MKATTILILLLVSQKTFCQKLDTTMFQAEAHILSQLDSFFKRDALWLGADGASSIDLGNGKILWLFSDSFISLDSSRSRKGSKIIRNSIALQQGYDLNTASIQFYWDRLSKEPDDFFKAKPGLWYWTGHGAMIKDKLMLFLMKVKEVKTGLGFEVFGWSAVLIPNPQDHPARWKMNYIDVPSTYGSIAGSAGVLKDQNYLYTFGVLESSHEVYLLRWKLQEAYAGNLSKPEWWFGDGWSRKQGGGERPKVLFTGATEFSAHYDPSLKKFLQIQSFGFGEAQLGFRMADSLQGPWSAPSIFYKPDYSGIKRPFMYSAKAHPEFSGKGLYITYNVNSFDFGELIENQQIYFPKFVQMNIEKGK